MKNTIKKIYHEILKRMPNKLVAYIDYFRTYKKVLNLKEPKYFQEKIQWIKLNANIEEYAIYADKYGVRDFVKKEIGEQYLIKLIGVYNSVEEIKFNELPEKFVLKCTHGSGYNIICKDKEKLDINKTKKQLNKWLKEDYYKIKGEMQYKNIPHKIVCEKYLEDESGDLLDYKFYCFNGEVKFVRVDFGRYSNHTTNFYDLNWNLIEMTSVHKNNENGIKKPEKLNEMLEIAQKLSQKFPHVRVDLYVVKNKIYFGELTFTTGGGSDPFTPLEKDLEIASWIDLNKYTRK